MYSVELYNEPREQVLGKISVIENEPEMTTMESAFLCGMIKEFKPKKIVEVGVAAGGTTAIVLQCLENMGYTYEMYSVDCCKQFYRDNTMKTGFLADELKEKMKIKCHNFYLGGTIADYIDDIGSEIDMLILDTTHVLPGELLDFIVTFPYLNKDAIVVLHDTVSNHIGAGYSFATKVLFNTVVADKYMCKDDNRRAKYPNIAAFKLNGDTKKYIENCFDALTITWSHLPTDEQLEGYLRKISENYSKDLYELTCQAVELNKHTIKYPWREKMNLYNRIKRSVRMFIKCY